MKPKCDYVYVSYVENFSTDGIFTDLDKLKKHLINHGSYGYDVGHVAKMLISKDNDNRENIEHLPIEEVLGLLSEYLCHSFDYFCFSYFDYARFYKTSSVQDLFLSEYWKEIRFTEPIEQNIWIYGSFNDIVKGNGLVNIPSFDEQLARKAILSWVN